MHKETITQAADTAARTPAQTIREEFAKLGLTVTGLRDDLTKEQAIEFCNAFLREVRSAPFGGAA